MKETKQEKYDKAYLRMAKEWGKLSYCKRKQVGAIIVKDRMIISDGYNGTPTGFENFCEDEEGYTKWYNYTDRSTIVKPQFVIAAILTPVNHDSPEKRPQMDTDSHRWSQTLCHMTPW